KGEFDEVVVPEIDGYKPSQAKVESKVVDGASSDQVVKVTYEKIKSEAKPTAEVKNEAKVQVAPTAEAKTSAKLQAKAQPKFVTTELPQTGEKQSKGTTIGAILVGLGSLLGLGALGKRKEK
ncbi:mucin-binding protein, partial [Bacillus subtilis]|uniref:mucin-binding protein n=1 Tax=Bacillus subtilis TaxID=1423 RepID=UPI0023EBF4AE